VVPFGASTGAVVACWAVGLAGERGAGAGCWPAAGQQELAPGTGRDCWAGRLGGEGGLGPPVGLAPGLAGWGWAGSR